MSERSDTATVADALNRVALAVTVLCVALFVSLCTGVFALAVGAAWPSRWPSRWCACPAAPLLDAGAR